MLMKSGLEVKLRRVMGLLEPRFDLLRNGRGAHRGLKGNRNLRNMGGKSNTSVNFFLFEWIGICCLSEWLDTQALPFRFIGLSFWGKEVLYSYHIPLCLALFFLYLCGGIHLASN
jgi:hypothetical protein